MSIHANMTPAEVEACTCDECGRMNAAVGIGESMAEIEAAVEYLPRQATAVGCDPETYLTLLRFIADFGTLRSLLIGQVDA